MKLNWMQEFSASITLCDTQGTIVYMNDRAIETFRKYGDNLIGKSLFDYHPEPALSKLKRIMEQKLSNCYTIEKGGIKKLIYQAPWFEADEYKGFVEISIELPAELPNFVRG
jgi:hypothetical protein